MRKSMRKRDGNFEEVKMRVKLEDFLKKGFPFFKEGLCKEDYFALRKDDDLIHFDVSAIKLMDKEYWKAYSECEVYIHTPNPYFSDKFELTSCIYCIYPVFLKLQNRMVPCGRCLPCRQMKSSEWTMRMEYEAQYHTDENGTSRCTFIS